MAANSTGASAGALPAELTSFVGRRHELSQARRLFASSRMLTLTGVGGVGKTRLALRLAAEVRRTFRDGVWLAELAALRDPHLLPNAVADTLDLRQESGDPTSDLLQFLEERQLLLVLDNCEHLAEACADLSSKLLAATPELRILATSRHVLGVEGEQILPVPPLSTPDEAVLAGDATHYESVRLFVERATAVDPGFVMDDGNRAAVVELCRRVDGIPLAIELAAVWLRVLSPAQILDRLEDRFRMLAADRPAAPARQQALHATVDWSYDLCSPAEQQLWARLSVFSGGFDLEAAEDVCAGRGIHREDILDLVASLVNKSILVRRQFTDGSNAWYEMLEIIRQYGAERLRDYNEVQEVSVRHRDHYRAMAAGFAAESFGPAQVEWFVRLRREHGNIRTALDFCLASPDEAPAALDIATLLWFFWYTSSQREGYRYLLRALEHAAEPTLRRATALWAAGYLAMIAGDFDQMDALLAEASELAERFDHDLLRTRILECRGHAWLYRGDAVTGVALLEQARAGYRSLGFPAGEFNALLLLWLGMLFLDDPRDHDLIHQALELADQHGALTSRAYALNSVGIVRWRAGDHQGAVRDIRECVRFFGHHHDLIGLGFGVQALGWCAASQSPDKRAARLLGASGAVWRASGSKLFETEPYVSFAEQAAAAVRHTIGSPSFEHAFAEGASYTVEQAVTLALGEESERPDGAAAPSQQGARPPDSLTPREREIAGLLTEGLSNKEIANRLVISPRTAETHVDHILTKLGMTSRTQAAAWIADQQARRSSTP
jgi:predicted ATPase/DNA-binding CsgD family transcriptional regulator